METTLVVEEWCVGGGLRLGNVVASTGGVIAATMAGLVVTADAENGELSRFGSMNSVGSSVRDTSGDRSMSLPKSGVVA